MIYLFNKYKKIDWLINVRTLCFIIHIHLLFTPTRYFFYITPLLL